MADQDGNTALHVAAFSNKTECMRVLLRGGGTDSLSIGKCIAQSIYLASLFHLISNNLNPCAFIAENKDGKTPMDISKELGHAESIELVSAQNDRTLPPVLPN